MHEALAWICASAIPLATVEAGNGVADLEPLRGVIGGARIVPFGDPPMTLVEFQMPALDVLAIDSPARPRHRQG